jgi:predicted permease
LKTTLRRFAARLAAMFDGARRERELHDELESHLQMQIDANIRAGMRPDEAVRRARVKLGNSVSASENIRDLRRLPSFESLLQDVRYGCRTLLASPGFALSTIGVLSLGIGTSVIAATIVHAVVWQPLAVPDPQSVVKIAIAFDGEFDRQITGHITWMSYPEFKTYQQSTRTLSGIAATRGESVVIDRGGTIVPAAGSLVTTNYFGVLRTRAAWGRLFTDADAASPAVVLSHRGWTQKFDGDPRIVGKAITIDRRVYEVVGVTEQGFTGIDVSSPDLWIPIEAFIRASTKPEWLTDVNRGLVEVVGRLAGGVPIEQARAEAATIAARFDAPYPLRRTSLFMSRASRMSGAFSLSGMAAARSSDFFKAGIGFTVAAGILTMILALCASNAAGLLLARGVTRHREIAVRVALGASRQRVLRQLVTESAIVAAVAGALGVTLGTWVLRGIAHLMPAGEVLATTRPGASVLLFALGVSTTTAIMFGLLPARAAAGVDPQSALRTDGPGMSAGTATLGLRNAILMGQVAATSVLLMSSALLTRGILEASAFDPGFDASSTYTLSIDLARQGYDEPRRHVFMHELLSRLRNDPSISRVGITSVPPLGGRGMTFAGLQPISLEQTLFNTCDRGYFDVLGIPLVAGRLFEPDEAANVAVVNEAFARRLWPGEPAPVGRRFFASGEGSTLSYDVIGIVKTVESVTIGIADPPTFYKPLARGQMAGTIIASGRESAGESIRAAVSRMNPDLFIGVTSIADQAARETAPTRVGAASAAIVGALALLISAIGIHGVVAYSVARRTREIGVHLALGATARDVTRLVLGTTMRPVVIGAIAGVVIAMIVARLLSHLLFGVSALDPIAFVTSSAVLTLATMLACYAPMRRALGIGPMTALRSD